MMEEEVEKDESPAVMVTPNVETVPEEVKVDKFDTQVSLEDSFESISLSEG